MARVLIFTTIEKLGYKSEVTQNGKLAPWVKDSIQKEYGIKKRELNHESIYASEVMNGDELYIEVISEKNDYESFEKVKKNINEANIRTRDDLDRWIKESGCKVLDIEGSVGMEDEYLIEVK